MSSATEPAEVRAPPPSGGRRARLAGAMTAQAVQALGGLVLSVAAARLLGAAGLAAFSLVYGAIVLGTALASGLVGDSWTVLDRSDPAVRSALGWWALAVTLAAAAGGAVLAAVSGQWPATTVLAVSAAAAAFLVQELGRRFLMAAQRYWSLVAMDAAGLAVTLGVLVGWVVATGDGTLGAVLGALAVGQTVSAALGRFLLPRADRRARLRNRPALREVWAFGSWRAAGQAVKPGVLTVMRTLVILVLGAAAYGPLEAARVYTAPLLVLVTGVSSFLLPSFAADRDRPARELLRQADRAAVRLALAVGGLGVAAVLAVPLAGPWITGGTFGVPAGAVAGWVLYTVSSATLMPYAALAAVLREQRRLLLLRSLEFLSLAAVAAVVLMAPELPALVPAALALGPAVTALAVRRLVAARAGAGG
jgi:O-antigen/teichoic acid export membrane protein